MIRRIFSRILGNCCSWSALAAVAVVVFSVLPLVFILSSSRELSFARWQSLWQSTVPELLLNTVKLAVLVTLFSVLLGVAAAWVVARFRFRGRQLLTWLLIIPLAIPTYVYADIYTRLFGSQGWLGGVARVWQVHVVDSPWLTSVGVAWSKLTCALSRYTCDTSATSSFSELLSASLVLSLASFSYVFLLVRASLSKSTRSLEEAARIQGADRKTLFRRIHLPMMRPAIAASAALVVLHTVSDFGGVAMLQYRTFTSVIYRRLDAEPGDLGWAAALSLVLVALALTFLVVERFFRQRQRYYTEGKDLDNDELKELSGVPRVLVFVGMGVIILFAVLLPVAWLLVQSWIAIQGSTLSQRFWSYAFNSFTIATIAATLALVCALPISLYHARRRNFLSASYVQGASVGFVLPGPVVALGVSLVFVVLFHELGNTLLLFAWIIAVVVRYLPLAIQSQEAALQQFTPSIDQAARILGAGTWERLTRVVLPIIRSGLIGAWVLVFIDALKELPAALLFKAQGFDTLPIAIWKQADEEMMEEAAPAALMLIVATLPALWLMLHGNRSRGASAP